MEKIGGNFDQKLKKIFQFQKQFAIFFQMLIKPHKNLLQMFCHQIVMKMELFMI